MTGVIAAAQAQDPQVVGGKAAALSKLTAAGFDVPPFLVLTDAAFRNAGNDLSDTAARALPKALAALGPGPYAVRSSARAEDGAEASHAGQFDTVLNVAAEALEQAARQVRASGLADHVARYRLDRGVEDAGLPAVLVQQMVPARVAGVGFSADPVSGRRDHALVSAVAGLADRLVSGEVDGESWTLDRDGQIVEAPAAAPRVLTADEAVEVAALARRAETAFGSPQDIEWAYDGARLFMLQARPITTGLRPVPMPDQWLVVLDNSNIVESYPGLVSPLTYSFAAYCYNRVYRAFVALLGLRGEQIDAHSAVFDNLLTRVDGRVYYNLGNWYRALALLPAFSLNRGYMETMMGVDNPLPEELTDRLAPPPAKGWGKVAALFNLARVAGGLLREALRLPGTKRRFMARLQEALEDGADTDHSLTELAAMYRQIEATLLDRWDAPLVNDFLCMMGFGASRGLLRKWAGDAGLEFHNDVMIGQGGIVSAEPARRIAEMGRMARDRPGAAEALAQGRDALRAFPELDSAVAAYLRLFGDRCTEELKLESLPLTENPAPLLAAIASAARRETPAEGRRHSPDWAGLMPGRPLRRGLARALTVWAAARVRDRENLRFERTRIFALARRTFLAMGREFHALGLIDDPRDVLFLTVQEVMGAVEGNALGDDLRALVTQRRAEMEASTRRPAPPERIELRGAVAAHAPGQAKSDAAPTGDSRTGTGCSKGTVTARARVIRDPGAEMLEPGEILVASNTDPGWIALFAGASAIVVERGSLLSHSAIVSREMGIPCVVGIRDATRWLQTGDVITVDGATGHVSKADG
ncbi:hypothetical protein KUV73_11885 [Mameliella alba]|nr:hypothetical protein [Mameliella alba]MBY6169955.1 hypothetical protein [Mameliella alba]MBY6175068.1 hypothetical protein [Mameliella alba]